MQSRAGKLVPALGRWTGELSGLGILLCNSMGQVELGKGGGILALIAAAKQGENGAGRARGAGWWHPSISQRCRGVQLVTPRSRQVKVAPKRSFDRSCPSVLLQHCLAAGRALASLPSSQTTSHPEVALLFCSALPRPCFFPSTQVKTRCRRWWHPGQHLQNPAGRTGTVVQAFPAVLLGRQVACRPHPWHLRGTVGDAQAAVPRCCPARLLLHPQSTRLRWVLGPLESPSRAPRPSWPPAPGLTLPPTPRG